MKNLKILNLHNVYRCKPDSLWAAQIVRIRYRDRRIIFILMIITKILLEISVKIWKMLENIVDILGVNFKPNR